MHLPTPNFHPKAVPEPPAMVRTVVREDVLWNRPVFKAPPLELRLRTFDATIFAADLRRIGMVQKQGDELATDSHRG